jgi:hypothetical protein
MRKKYKILSFKASGTVIPHSLTDVQTTLSEMGHRVFVIDLPAIEDVKLNEIAIMDALVDINPDLVITIDSVGLIPCQYLTFSPKMKVISWFFDDPVPFLQGMDVTLFNSRYHLFSWDRAYEDVVKKMGVSRFYYMPFATNPKIYQPLKCEKKYDVSFVGTWSEKRGKVLRSLAENGVKIDLFGNTKWLEYKHPNICFHGFADNRNECPQIYSQSKINLNITNEQLLTALPLRIFDVGICKTFLLTDYREDAEKLFSRDELVIYHDMDDLISKISYYLKNDNERDSISQKMYEKVSAEFTYRVKLEQILELTVGDKMQIPDVQLDAKELNALWKKALSLMHFSKYEEAISHLNFINSVLTPNAQIRIVIALTLAVCLKMSGRENEAENLVKNNQILQASYARLGSIKDYGEFRAALYYLKENSFNSEGEVPNGIALRV